MRIDGVTRIAAFRREPRHDRPETGLLREPFRFSSEGYILDLTREAMAHTGRGDMRVARHVPAPPDSYNETGELAYYDPPAPPMKLEMPADIAAKPDDTPPPPPVSGSRTRIRASAPRVAI